MSLYSPPPPLHTFGEDKPTLLVCWWITLFCTSVILIRMLGRFIRSEKLFKEDKTAGYAIIPLFMRMGCVHFILIWGTNNAQLPDDLSERDIRRKSIASGLVLASRILQATTYVAPDFSYPQLYRGLLVFISSFTNIGPIRKASGFSSAPSLISSNA